MFFYVKSSDGVEVRHLGLNMRTEVQILCIVSYYRFWKWFSLFIKHFLLCKYTNSVTMTKLEILFVTNCFVQLAGFEPMPSCLESCIQNTKFQMQLMISLICVKVSELWNSNAIAENTNKVLVRACFQPDTYVICIWFILNTVQ